MALFRAILALAVQGAESRSPATVTHASFGSTPDGRNVERYVLTNRHGAVAKVITYGAALVELDVPDRSGKLGDVVLGFDTLEGYLSKRNPYFGAVQEGRPLAPWAQTF